MIVTAALQHRRADSTFPPRDRSRVSQVTSEAYLPSDVLSFVRPIMVASAKAAGLTTGQFLNDSRTKTAAMPRQAAMWLAYHLTLRSFKDISIVFLRDHTTVVNAVRRTDERLSPDHVEYAATRDFIRTALLRLREAQTCAAKP
jgi:chromosomal replication initiation ATPase DnaA